MSKLPSQILYDEKSPPLPPQGKVQSQEKVRKKVNWI